MIEACGGDLSRAVFLDEFGGTTSMTRTHGRCERGRRCVGRVPAGHWKVLTGIAAVRTAGLFAPFTIDCPTDAAVFQAYVDRVLVPTLRQGDVVVMDNLSSHKPPGVARSIEAAGAAVMYLPPYSPDLNPIETVWSKVKRLLRSLEARTLDALHDAFGTAMAAVTPQDTQGCFRHIYATA